jgi:Transposase DDE domain
VAAIWFPLAAVLTPANVADSEPAPALLREVPAEVRFVLGDRHCNTSELHENCEQADRLKVPTTYGRYPHTDDGVEVRRVFHKLRSRAMEHFHEHFKGIFDGHGQVPDLWPDCHPALCVRGHLCLSTGLDFSALSTTWNCVSALKLS